MPAFVASGPPLTDPAKIAAALKAATEQKLPLVAGGQMQLYFENEA